MKIYAVSCNTRNYGKSVSIIVAQTAEFAYNELKTHGKLSSLDREYDNLIACIEVGCSNAQYEQIVIEELTEDYE